MKAICVVKPHVLEIQERPMPVIASANDVLIKVKMGGICGSDMHIFHGTSPVASYPRIIGHEVAGLIVDKGDQVRSFEIGDHVVLDPVIHCGTCYQCEMGRRNVCANLLVRGVHVDGGYQEFIVLPQNSIHKIPDKLQWKEAIMVEPFTIAEQVCYRSKLNATDIVFIMGAGPVGLSVLKLAKLHGAKCFISDIHTQKLDIAKDAGADVLINASEEDVETRIKELTSGIGATLVVDAVCTSQSFGQTLDYVCSAGRIITLGFSSIPSSIEQFKITAREIDILGSRLHNNHFPKVIEYFESGKLKVIDMITHEFPFTEIHDAFNLIEDSKIFNGKVVLSF